MAAVQETVDRVRSIDVEAYKYGFVSPIESEVAPKGLNEDIIKFISAKKEEPEWLLQWRLEAFRRCFTEGHDPAKCRDGLERFVHVAPVSANLARGAELLSECRIGKVQEFIARRIAAEATASTP